MIRRTHFHFYIIKSSTHDSLYLLQCCSLGQHTLCNYIMCVIYIYIYILLKLHVFKGVVYMRRCSKIKYMQTKIMCLSFYTYGACKNITKQQFFNKKSIYFSKHLF
jgi:hypothetical protein